MVPFFGQFAEDVDISSKCALRTIELFGLLEAMSMEE
jgi:hypothetical protein